MSDNKKHFLLLIVTYFILTAIVMMVVPIGKLWLILAAIFVVFSIPFQLYYNRHFNDKN